MSEFIMLIGPAGCGKSTVASTFAKYGYVVLSSDAIRREITGSEETQTQNAQVFNLMLKRARDAILAQQNVVYDATNISEKRRIGLLDQLPKNISYKKIAWIVLAKPKTIIENDFKRDRTVGIDVINRHLQSFKTPYYFEGWDEIICESTQLERAIVKERLLEVNDTSHDNPHHPRGILEHMNAASQAARAAGESDLICTVLQYHDIGKAYTKVFYNYKGEKTDIAHYYGHDGYGAYMTLLSNIPNKLEISWYIAHHMDLFFSDEKKLREKYGNEITDNLVKIHYYDTHFA